MKELKSRIGFLWLAIKCLFSGRYGAFCIELSKKEQLSILGGEHTPTITIRVINFSGKLSDELSLRLKC
tara:strand:+ start:663 stop:869 length:207 start_codon:yes stop_codon:yes gene_type:complete